MSDRPVRYIDDVESFPVLDETPAGRDPVRRPLTGIVVIALALIAVTAVAVGRPKTVSGAAVVPPPPQVGDCVPVAVTDQILDQGWNDTDGSGVPVLVAAPCTGSRAGEVVSVDDHRVYSQGDCWTPAVDYIGLPAPTRTVESASDAESSWVTRAQVFSFTFGPSPLQVAAGQLWSACVLTGVSDDDDPRPQPLLASARDAARQGGIAFEPFASCANSPSPEGSAPCVTAHRYEVMGDAVTLGPSEADTLASCTALVTELTGLQDPSAGGRLEIGLTAYRYDQAAGAVRVTTYQQARAEHGGVTCTVSPARAGEMLTSTLVGLGDRPLPVG